MLTKHKENDDIIRTTYCEKGHVWKIIRISFESHQKFHVNLVRQDVEYCADDPCKKLSVYLTNMYMYSYEDIVVIVTKHSHHGCRGCSGSSDAARQLRSPDNKTWWRHNINIMKRDVMREKQSMCGSGGGTHEMSFSRIVSSVLVCSDVILASFRRSTVGSIELMECSTSIDRSVMSTCACTARLKRLSCAEK